MSVAPFSSSTNSASKLTAVPSNLDALPKDELVRLLKRVASERNDLVSSSSNNKKQKTAPAAAALPSFNVPAAKKRIASTAKKLIKKTAHNRSKKPWTELSEQVPDLAACLELFSGFATTSETARLLKWELSGAEIAHWLNMTDEPYVHPVKFDGKVWAFAGAKVHIYAWAGFETLQAKYEKKTGNLQLKFRTYMVGAGNPNGSGGPPYTY